MAKRVIPGGHLKHISKYNNPIFASGQELVKRIKAEAEEFKQTHNEFYYRA